MADVAILGTGRMGAAIARRVAGAGHQVTVWNRTEAKALEVAQSLPPGSGDVARTVPDAVRGRDVVLSMLADGDATCAVVLDGPVLAELRPDAVVCDLATSGVRAARDLDAGLRAAGVGYVDAPVSGSVAAVESGTLLVMASGAPAAVEGVRPVLESFARHIMRVGDAGSGQAMKLAVNLVVHDLNAAVAEALVLAENAGITQECAYDVLEESVVGAPFVKYKRQAFLDPEAPVAMSLELVMKDLHLITGYAHELSVPTEVTTAAQSVVAAACAAGFGVRDMASLNRFLAIRPIP